MTQIDRLIEGRNDFIPLYSGPHLIASGDLYDNARLLEKEAEATGFFSATHGYMRPPFFAGLMWPLSQLPYRVALRIWQVASLAALIGFVLLWPSRNRLLVGLAVAMSIPALLVLLKGQDVHFLLLLVAVIAKLHLSGRPRLAGMVFALCAAKVHLFLLTPVWILARRDWEFLKGLLYGGAVLAAASTMLAGWRWPLEMWHETQNPTYSPALEGMPNLHGAFAGVPASFVWEGLLSLGAAWAVWTIGRRSSFLPSFAAALLGGVLLARHSYLLDLSLLVPAALVVLDSAESMLIKLGAALLLAPPVLFMTLNGSPYSVVLVLVCWAVLVGWAVENRFAGDLKARQALT